MNKFALCLLMIALMAISGYAQTDRNEETLASKQVISESVNISSGNMTYPAYLAAPAAVGDLF
jgi:hypothetical protein